jgi:outer membrane protein TolC
MLIAAALAGPAAAQTLRRVEFDDAINQALERNPTVAQAATAIARADGILRQTRAGILPGASAGILNSTLDSARGFDGGVTQPQNQFAFTANLSVPVLAAGQWAAVTHARDQIGVARLSAADVRQQVAVSAAQAYLSVIAGHRQVDVDERALENARAHLDYADRRLQGGAGSRLNQLRAAQAAASAESRLEATRLALRLAQEALGVLLAEDGPVDVGGEPVFEVPDTTGSEWMAARPDVQLLQAVRQAAERVLADSWKDWVPLASASFDPQYITPSGLFQPSRTWRLSVTLSQPLFEGGARRAARALRAVAVEQSALALTATEIQARSETRLAREAIAILERASAAADRAAAQAVEVLQITTTAFQVGATTNIEVIDAQRSARDAELAATLVQDALRRAHLDLLVAVGRFPR